MRKKFLFNIVFPIIQSRFVKKPYVMGKNEGHFRIQRIKKR